MKDVKLKVIVGADADGEPSGRYTTVVAVDAETGEDLGLVHGVTAVDLHVDSESVTATLEVLPGHFRVDGIDDIKIVSLSVE